MQLITKGGVPTAPEWTLTASGEVMKVTSNSTVTPMPAKVDGWIVAFVMKVHAGCIGFRDTKC